MRASLARAGVVATFVVAIISVGAAPALAATTWTLVGTAAGASYGSLAAVACPTAANCYAVGILDSPTIHTRLIEHWNGAKWSAVSTPSPPGATSSQLTAVHCASATSCFAVGEYSTPLMTNALALRWDGKRWSIMTVPNPVGASVTELSGVRCTSSTSCVAVGGYIVSSLDSTTELTLVEQWNGSAWSIVPSPNPLVAGDSSLEGVTCTAPTSCIAVGSYSTDLVTNTLIEQWDGSTWTIASSPNPGSSTNSELFSVACTSPTACFAVGTGHGTLVEQWDGSVWSIVTSANPTGTSGLSLTAVSCPSPARCFAVGDLFRKTAVQRLVELWNGRSWSAVGVPVPSGTKLSSLSGVWCATVSSCSAVGYFRAGPSRRPLLERFG